MSGQRINIGVVGATGQVGVAMRQILEQRQFPVGDVRFFASARSAGTVLPFAGREVVVEDAATADPSGLDVALFSAGATTSKALAPAFAEAGAVVVDNSSAWRNDPEVPLVVSEVNPHAIDDRPKGIIANPNCTTLSMIVPLGALHRELGLKELVVSSYQAASGAGKAGIDTLRDQIAKVAGDPDIGTRTGDIRATFGDQAGPFPAPLALNVVPWAGSLRDGGWSSEELKVRNESRKILGMPDLKVVATCVRVPVVTGHSLTVHAVFEREVTQERAQEILAAAQGLVLCDNPAEAEFPTPADVVGTDPTWVGRVRVHPDDARALEMFVCGDNLRKGAALNTAQIAEVLAAEFTAG